jgi:ribonuclease P protein component
MWIPQKNENRQGTSHCKQQKKTRKKETYNRVGLSFPKSIRLLSRGQFHRVNREGKRFTGKAISLQYKEGYPRTRLGITVSKKYGKSHDRNRFKRVVREAFRECYSTLPIGISFNIFPRLPRSDIGKQAILDDLQSFLKQSPC